VKRVIARHESGGAPPGRRAREHSCHAVTELVAELVEKTKGRISAKWLLPAARAAGHAGTARNLRRLVAERKALWRNDHHRGRRPAVWTPEHLVIDWGVQGGLHVFCAVLACRGVRFVRSAHDERADTTLALLAECSSRPSARSPAWCSPTGWDARKGGVVANCHRSQFLYQQQAHE